LLDIEQNSRLIPGENRQTLNSFYARHKESIDQVAEIAGQELQLRTGENANYNFMQKFATDLPLKLKVKLIKENIHQALPSTVLHTLALYTDTYRGYIAENKRILNMDVEELFPEQ
jgi:hypothetical protein